jgi:hypothetical protein
MMKILDDCMELHLPLFLAVEPVASGEMVPQSSGSTIV